MGRWSWSNKTEADNLKKVEIWWLKKYGYLDGLKSGGMKWTNSWSDSESSIGFTVSTYNEDKYIQFQYSQIRDNNEKDYLNYKVALVSTDCNFGGKRWWFICPLTKNNMPCNRRVGVLYKNGDYFGCRHCLDLTYKSKNRNYRTKYGYLFKIFDIEEQLEKVESEMKRYYYAGKPTRKYKKIQNIIQKSNRHYTLLKNNKML